MANAQLSAMLHGALAALSLVAAAFFARYYRSTKDRFFIYFAAAFAVFCVNWTLLALVDDAPHQPYLFFIRLAGFLLILVAILVKNRAKPGAS